MSDNTRTASDIADQTTEIVSAYVTNNTVAREDLPALIIDVSKALQQVYNPGEEKEPEQVYEGAVTIRKSLSDPNHIISMIDGKPYKMLTRHLTTNGLTPDEYRKRYNLPADYPMTAPNYSEKRRDLAKQIGLGRKPGETRSKKK